MTTTNTVKKDDKKEDEKNKTNDERDVLPPIRVNCPNTETKSNHEQNDSPTGVKTPEPADVTAPYVSSNDSITVIASIQGEKKVYRQHDTKSRGSRRSSKKVSSIASSKREIDKEKNEVKIRFLEEQSALEEEIQQMEMEAETLRREMEAEATRRQMEVESAKRRFRVETLKAEARRDGELARIEEDKEITDEEGDDGDEVSYAETIDRWVESTVAEKVERVSHGDRTDAKDYTDAWTDNKPTNQQTFIGPMTE